MPVIGPRLCFSQLILPSCFGEGSYGLARDSQAGTLERWPSAEACAPQLVAACGADCSPLSQWAASAFASSQFTSTDWSALQATGEPDTLVCGDIITAWAPGSNLDDLQWLEVEFATPVLATGVDIYETYATGGVYLIEARDTDGILRTVWSGDDPTTCPGVLDATWPQTTYLVSAIRIHTQIIDWEEIDAVNLDGLVCAE